MTTFRRGVTPDTFCQDFARLFLSHRMYPSGNEHVRASAERAAQTIREYGSAIRFSKMGNDVVLEDGVLQNAPKGMVRFVESFDALRWESVKFSPEIGVDGLLKVVARVATGAPGPFSCRGFIAGALKLDGDDASINLLREGAGYLNLVPVVEELMADVRDNRKGAWTRAHEVVRTLSEYLLSGEDLFGAVQELKDYDEYTFMHALNVSLLSTAMARTMQAQDHIVDAIAMGGLCHDIGKQTVPMEVLRKPSKLTPEERALMDRHPVEGAAKILLTPGGCPPLVPVIAYEHHMRADCSGYPKLPVAHTPHPASLLISVADTYDALRTLRPYQQKAFDPAAALSILIEEASTGRLHRVFVSVFARILNVVTPGRRLTLANGEKATVLAVGEFDALQPLVETEQMEILDLSMPGTVQIVDLEENMSTAQVAPGDEGQADS
jgi:HD-GYP domain-containing protein (c-di-GMP phosphodiesterase class II)